MHLSIKLWRVGVLVKTGAGYSGAPRKFYVGFSSDDIEKYILFIFMDALA